MSTCLATPPGYWGELPPRCHEPRGHAGPHSTGSHYIGMGFKSTEQTWDNEEAEDDAA